MPSDTMPRSRFRRAAVFAALAVASAAPAAAQSGGERVGDWTVAKIAVSEGGNVCSALRLYGSGYGVEIVQARGLPGQLIMRLESPKITGRPGQTGEEIEPGENLHILISNVVVMEPWNVVVRQGPRGLGFIATLKDTASYLRSGQAIRAIVAYPDGSEDKLIGSYSLTGSGAALDALSRCANGLAATAPAVPSPAPASARQQFPAPAAGRLPVPFGRYTANGDCATADLILTPKYWGDDGVGDGWAIGPFHNLGGNRWALSPAVTITVTGPRSFTVKGRTMTWCGA